ncbi:aminopeptidase P family protein [Candidatus Woesearchaeota archaeon]|nr:aminopeptidase P family protein [Candidatus Woesearchaeota archaeon]
MRLVEFQSRMDSAGIDACVLSDDDPSVFYFAGVELERCFLVIPSMGRPRFLVSRLEQERVRSFSRIKDVVAFRDFQGLRSSLESELGSFRSLAVNKAEMSVRDFELLGSIKGNLLDANDIISAVRQVKSFDEVELLRESCRIAARIMQRCIEGFDFRTEQEVKDFLEAEARKDGCRPSFETIVASGHNASMPHYFGSGRIARGFCVIDFGVRHKGYCSDMTRTVYVGSPSSNDRGLYRLVLSAQEMGIGLAVDGAVAGDVDAGVRNLLGKHKSKFIHGLGHHIGVEVHDAGFRLSHGSRGVLRENMVLTVEPGLYFKGKRGIRIEDDVLVRKLRSEVLTSTVKDLVRVA